MKPIFRKEYHEYRRDFDYIKQWAMQCATYAHLQDRSIDKEEYTKWVMENTSFDKDTMFKANNPRMKMIIKDENNDRQMGVITMLDYLRTLVRDDLKFAPTFTTYRSERVQRAVESDFLQIGMKNRKVAKKAMFKAREEQNEVLADYQYNMQLMLKILNNSSSGAHATPSNILYNQTGHSTLTSICRSTTSFANATNERFLAGYRHYYCVETVNDTILAMLTWMDLDEVERVMKKYNLHYISQEEFLQVIRRSTSVYWKSEKMFDKIVELVSKLTPLECSACLYNSDFFHLRIFNEQFVRDWLTKMVNKNELTPLPMDEAKKWCSLMDDDLAALISIYCTDLVDGKSVGSAMSDRPEIIPTVGAIVKNTIDVLEEYRDLIHAFWVTDIAPGYTAAVPNMMRAVVVGSDTDSSLFSQDEWVEWYRGYIVHDNLSNDIDATVVYLVSQHIAHVLGMMTGILNIVDEKKPLLAMKNEFLFSTFTTTPKGKHYFARSDAQEGVVYKKGLDPNGKPYKLHQEIKGVGLQHSRVPKVITDGFHDTLTEVMDTIVRDEKISVSELIRKVALIEYNVYQSIKSGESTYFSNMQVKVNEAYKVEDNAYKRGYVMWETIFAPKYGSTIEPPYGAIKVSIIPNTPSKFNAWVDTFEDQQLAQRLRDWIYEQNHGRPLYTFLVPQQVATVTGMPVELMSALNLRKLVYTQTAPYYTLLESLGIYMINDKLTRLCSDNFEDTIVPHAIMDDESGIDESDE